MGGVGSDTQATDHSDHGCLADPEPRRHDSTAQASGARRRKWFPARCPEGAGADRPARCSRERPVPPPGAFVFVLKEACMFEGQPQSELDALFKANPEFRQLYPHHKELDKKVLDAELGVLPVDDTT